MQREVIQVDMETLPMLARKLYEQGLTREEARQRLREKFYNANDEKKKTIVAKIKKYILKFWKDGPLKIIHNQEQAQEQIENDDNIIKNPNQQQNVEQQHQLIQKNIIEQSEIQEDPQTLNPQETAKNLIEDIKNLQQNNNQSHQAHQNISNVIQDEQQSNLQELQQNQNQQKHYLSQYQHILQQQKQNKQKLIQDEQLKIFEQSSHPQQQQNFFERLNCQKNIDNFPKPDAAQQQVSNVQQIQPLMYQLQQQQVGEKLSRKRMILDRLSSVIEEQDVLEQKLKRLKTEQKLLSEQLANSQKFKDSEIEEDTSYGGGQNLKLHEFSGKSYDQTHAETPSSQVEYQLSPLRWWLQIFFTTGLLSNGFIMVGFSPVSSSIAGIFQCQQILVDLQCLLFLIMFIPANFLVIKVLDLYGLRACLIIGSVMTICGCWLRQLVTVADNFSVVFPGTILCATAQVFYINTGSKLATNWFGDKERALATALGGLALPIGCVIGFVVPAFFMGGEDDTKDAFVDYLITQNAIVTILSAPILFLAKEKPPSPPSLSANKVDPKLEFGKELKKLLGNRSYIFLSGTFTFLYGIYTSLGAVVASVTAPFGYTPIDNSIFGATFIFFGVVGSFFFGIMLDKYAKYKLIINLTATCAVIFITLAFWTLQSGSVALFSINLAFVGFFVIPIIPSSYAFAVELTYPVPESMSNGMMIMVSQIYGATLGALASYVSGINGTQGPLIAIGIFVTSCALGALCSYFIKEELRRLRPQESPQVSPYTSGDFSTQPPSISLHKEGDEAKVAMLQGYKENTNEISNHNGDRSF